MDNVISKEAAEAQVTTLLDYYGIEKADIALEDGPEAAQTMFNTLTRAIQKGVLEIVDEGDLLITQRLTHPINETDRIVYADRIGRAKIAMDSASSKKPYVRQNAFMSAMGDVPISVITKLKGFDMTVYTRLATVFSLV